MRLSRYMMGWVVLTVLCLPVCSAVAVVQPYSVLSTNGTARVECVIQARSENLYPYADPQEVRVTLLRGLHGSRELCSAAVSVTEPQRAAGVSTEGEVQCTAQVSGGAVVVTASGLKAADTDIYRCDVTILFPPPLLRLKGNGTLVHVRDSCPEPGAEGRVAPRVDEEEGDGRDETVTSVPVVVLVMLVVFVLVVIVYFQALQCRRGRREVVRTVLGGAHKVEAVSVSFEDVQGGKRMC